MQHVEIRVKGRIDERWSEWFADLTLTHAEGNETVLTGQVVDQATLYGLLTRLRDLGLQLISVSCDEQERRE
ncbi:MAG TPA: hypothetical protein VJ793_19980 [Anaerolineae bacterium]|nr:hypothetical protein [Anaerolineae bacterium]